MKDNQYWREIRLISQLERGEWLVDIGHNVKLARTKVHTPTICNNADRIKEGPKSGTKVRYKIFLFKGSTTESTEKNVECLNKGSESMPCACKHAFVQAKVQSIYEDLSKVMIMLNQLV